MKAIDLNSRIIDSYFAFLKGLSKDNKLRLMRKLSNSIKEDKEEIKTKEFDQAFGAWESKESAEDLVKSIRKSRNFNRNIEEF